MKTSPDVNVCSTVSHLKPVFCGSRSPIKSRVDNECIKSTRSKDRQQKVKESSNNYLDSIMFLYKSQLTSVDLV